MTLCPQCGPRVAVDEDGCCAMCGATACGEGVARLNLELREIRDLIKRATGWGTGERLLQQEALARIAGLLGDEP